MSSPTLKLSEFWIIPGKAISLALWSTRISEVVSGLYFQQTIWVSIVLFLDRLFEFLFRKHCVVDLFRKFAAKYLDDDLSFIDRIFYLHLGGVWMNRIFLYRHGLVRADLFAVHSEQVRFDRHVIVRAKKH